MNSRESGPVAERAMEMLEEIGGVVGETAQEMWPHVVRYIWASGVAETVFAAIITIGIVTLFGLLIRSLKKWQPPEGEDEAGKVIGLVVCTACIVITISVGAYHAAQGLIMIIEPTGAALKMVLEGVL